MEINSFQEATARMFDCYGEAVAAFTQLGMQGEFKAVVSATVAPERVSHFLEIVYANHAEMPPSVKAAAADVGAFASEQGFYGLSADGRGMAMVAVLRGQKVKDAPLAMDRFKAPSVADGNAGTEPAATPPEVAPA